jgi:hypothetical protein
MTNTPGEDKLRKYTDDVFLETLIQEVTLNGLYFDITITIHGQLFTGTVISGREFFEACGQVFKDRRLPTETIIQPFIDSYPDQQSIDGTIDVEIKPVAYLHLKNVQVVTFPGNGAVLSELPYWRFLISRIDGWTLGSLEPQKIQQNSEAQNEGKPRNIIDDTETTTNRT